MAQSLSVTISDINKDLKKKESQFAKAINATTSDFGRRGQGWVSQEVRKVYGTDLKTIKSTYKGFKKDGKIKVGGVKIDNIKLIYNGRLLTITHFKMTPKVRPSGNRPYQVKAEIIKGARKVVNKAFLAEGRGGATLAWRRVKASGGYKGKGNQYPSRYPIRPIKTVSVPQMVSSKRTQPAIQKRIGEELTKRWEHNVSRFNK